MLGAKGAGAADPVPAARHLADAYRFAIEHGLVSEHDLAALGLARVEPAIAPERNRLPPAPEAHEQE